MSGQDKKNLDNPVFLWYTSRLRKQILVTWACEKTCLNG